MNIRRLVLTLPLLLAAAAPVAEARDRHVEINVGLGHPPAHLYAPAVVYRPVHHGYYYQPQHGHHYNRHNQHNRHDQGHTWREQRHHYSNQHNGGHGDQHDD